MDAKSIALIAVIAVAPLAIVLIIALLRGYRMDLHLDRNGKHRRPEDQDDQ